MNKKAKLHMPHVYSLIFILIVLVSIMTWVIPSGEFNREVVDTAAGERSVAIAGTYHTVDKIDSEGVDLRQGVQAILQAPGKGIQAAVEVLAFVFIIGGVFQIIAKTNALNLGMRSLVKKLGRKEILIIPILMVLFGIGGSTFGMSDELVPFYLLIMPVLFAIGYDSVTTFMVVFVGASTGYAASTINPFNVLVAQGVAGIQGNPQLEFRIIQWVIMMAIVIVFVTIRAQKIKKNPQVSIMYEADLKKRQKLMSVETEKVDFSAHHKLVIAIFVAGMILVVIGLIKYGWYMNELSMCFLGMGLVIGIVGRLNERVIAEEFVTGLKDIAFVAILIGLCSGILVVAQDGMIIDTILNTLSNTITGVSNGVFVGVMYAVQSLLTFLVPSSSGLAALTIPVMSSLCDLQGVNPEASVTVLQYSNQLTNMMSPVAGTTVAGLAVCGIGFGKWWKTFWKVFLVLTVVAIMFGVISAGL